MVHKINLKNAEIIQLNGSNMTIELLYKVSTAKVGSIELRIHDKSLKKMHASRKFVNEIVEKGDPVYGINTGFGALANVHIQRKDLAQLQLNLIRSHCTGVGKPFSIDMSRAIMVLRANCLISGFSGINPNIVQLLLDFLNYGVSPVVPEQGSVGASGDLAPLSHIALALIGEGEVEFQGKTISSHFAINYINKVPVVLGPKDGLALINGTAVMAALGAMAIHQARHYMKLADISNCMTLDGVRGTKQAYHPLITSVKPHVGQLECSYNLNKLLEGSQIVESHDKCGKVQDPYSLRCTPQVHGGCRQTLNHSYEIIDKELNAVTDNPLIFVESQEVISGGNFHGEALALAMDYLAMGLAEICSISERRIEKMMNPTFSDLPSFLGQDSGLNSGFMIAHVTAAALTSENKYLCHPASVDSIPTSTDKEDHVSMGVTCGRKLHQVLENVKHCLAIELMCNAQALEFQLPEKTSPALQAVVKVIRNHVPPLKQDRVLYKDIQSIVKLIGTKEIINAAENITGKLK
jgi:histidine ammonia-lyase